eukprot:7976230-Pyramimonas_sp.AAC.2
MLWWVNRFGASPGVDSRAAMQSIVGKAHAATHRDVAAGTALMEEEVCEGHQRQEAALGGRVVHLEKKVVNLT